MKILGIDTTTNEAVVYLKNDDLVDIRKLDKKTKVSENLLFYIDDLLTSNKLSLTDVDVVACCVGPGSFTGIRIGIATCKAFMVANTGLKCVIYNAFDPYLNMVKKGILYSSCTKSSFYKCNVEDSKIIKLDVIEKNKVEFNDGEFLIGEDETAPIKNKVEFDFLKHIEVVENKIKLNDFVSENEITPNYVCDSQAERNLKNAK